MEGPGDVILVIYYMSDVGIRCLGHGKLTEGEGSVVADLLNKAACVVKKLIIF